MNPGRMILENVLAAGFAADDVTVIKPGATEIVGCRCVPDLGSLGDRVDLLIVSVDAGQVPALIEQVVAGEAAESVIIIPGGLGEIPGSETAADHIERSIARSRASTWGGPVINGANSLGIRSIPGRYDAFFTPSDRGERPDAASVALLSQSGAFLLSRLDRLPWLRPRYEVSLGNQVDLTAGDYLTYFAADPGVAVAACYLEGFRPGDGLRWLEAATTMIERGGAVVLYRGGRSPAGAASAASHTAVVAGDYAVTVRLAESAGVLVADTLEEFEEFLKLTVLLHDCDVGGLRAGAVSNAGFECVAIADGLGPLRLADFAAPTVSRLDAIFAAGDLAGIAGSTNPADLTPGAAAAAVAESAAAVLADPGVDVGIVGTVPFTPALDTDPDGALAGALLRLRAEQSKAWVAVLDARDSALAGRLEAGGVPVFGRADQAVAAFGRYCVWRIARAGETGSAG
jgi:acyl-CoA synthetase (NDP forming)